MIGYINGEVVAIRGTYAIVMAGGVGYKVFASKESLAPLFEGTLATFWIHTVVREDTLDLFGFPHEDELRFFELLLSVSGIGPRSALGILDAASTETLRSAIAAGNAAYLTTISGIGKKTAEKIVLELRDKVGIAGQTAASISGDAEALEALRALGYSTVEARDALKQVPAHIENANDRIRAALKLVGSHTRS